ncbi:MAG: AI-2E family transporter [Pseudomonadota bacterium]|nr:AI-2E family transporter [Pseudomonadota bacterium]
MTDSSASQDGACGNREVVRNWAITGIFWILVLGALSLAQGVFVPIISAFVLALTFSPVRRVLEGLGIPSSAAAGMIMISLLIVFCVLFYFISEALQEYLVDAPTFAEEVRRELSGLFGTIEPVLKAGDQIDALTNQNKQQTVALREPGFVSVMTQATPAVVSQLVVTLTLSFFLMASGDMFYEKLVQVMPKLKDKRRALAAARTIENQLSTYLFTISAINATLGVIIGLVMWLAGMPNPLLFGLGAFLLNYIPYIGSIGGITITLVTGLVTFDSTIQGILPALLYWIINTIEGQFLTPVLVGRRLKLNAVVVFISFALWAWVWSFMGMLLSTPILLMAKVVSDNVNGLESFGKFLGDRDDLSGSDSRLLKFVFRQKDRSAAEEA